MIALIEQHLEQIAALCRQYGVERLEVFGSAATGAFDVNTSDIDFIVRFGTHDTLNRFNRYFGFTEDLETLLKYPIDLLVDQPFHNPYFAQSVEKSRQTVYDRQRKKVSACVMTACDDIASYIAGKTEQDYLENKLLRHGVERALEIVGEALKNVRLINPDTAREITNVHRIIALRNRLIHAYDDISNEIIWSAASEEAPKLRIEVSRLLGETR